MSVHSIVAVQFNARASDWSSLGVYGFPTLRSEWCLCYFNWLSLFVVYWTPLCAFKATLAKARRREQVDPIEHEQALLERGGFRFPEHLLPKVIWEELISGYMKVIF